MARLLPAYGGAVMLAVERDRRNAAAEEAHTVKEAPENTDDQLRAISVASMKGHAAGFPGIEYEGG